VTSDINEQKAWRHVRSIHTVERRGSKSQLKQNLIEKLFSEVFSYNYSDFTVLLKFSFVAKFGSLGSVYLTHVLSSYF